ncbi:hypothetical protein ACIQYO_24430 [Methylobacterium sp. NPDC097178]|nr:hypothetical protein [Methylobacterium jeotgali]
MTLPDVTHRLTGGPIAQFRAQPVFSSQNHVSNPLFRHAPPHW